MPSRHVHGLWSVLSLLTPLALAAQQTGAIRGRVSDAATDQPVTDARVTIEQTTLGTTSLPNGQYALGGVPAGHHVLLVRRVGYAIARQDVDVPVADTTEVNVALRAAAVALDAIVVKSPARARAARS